MVSHNVWWHWGCAMIARHIFNEVACFSNNWVYSLLLKMCFILIYWIWDSSLLHILTLTDDVTPHYCMPSPLLKIWLTVTDDVTPYYCIPSSLLHTLSENKNLHPRVRVDQAVRPLPPKTLSILVGLILKLTSMCITIYKFRKVWTVWSVLVWFLSNSLKGCFSMISEKEFVRNCVRDRKSNLL